MRLLKREKDALVELLMAGAASPEDMAEAVAKRLDELRGERSHNYACMIIAGIPLTIGPFATDNQANKAAQKLGADKLWLVSGYTAEGWERRLDDLDKPYERKPLTAKQEAANNKGFWGRVSEIKDGDRTAITGKVEIKPVPVAPLKGAWG